MKKWIIVPIALIAVALLAVYIAVPSKISLSQSVTINCTNGAAERYLVNNENWYKWWPVTKSSPARYESDTKLFPYKHYTFLPRQRMFGSIRIDISVKDVILNSKIVLIPKHKDSVTIQWNVDYYTANTPVARVKRYLHASGVNRVINDIMAKAKRFLETTSNVYGIDVRKTIVQDSVLLSIKKVFTTEPSTQDIYTLVNKLRTYIQQQGARETGSPMLNIQRKNSTQFETMVAIPLDKAVTEKNGMVLKYLVRGYILVTEVKGGPHTATKALTQMETYMSDHRYESPAIPFYTLITDRTAETDTSKWVTRISYPVF